MDFTRIPNQNTAGNLKNVKAVIFLGDIGMNKCLITKINNYSVIARFTFSVNRSNLII